MLYYGSRLLYLSLSLVPPIPFISEFSQCCFFFFYQILDSIKDGFQLESIKIIQKSKKKKKKKAKDSHTLSEDKRMSSKDMKRCSKLFATREIHTNTRMREFCTPIRMAKIKSTIPSSG